MFFFSEALRLYGNRLSDYEKTEIEKYSKIWYLGLSACKIPGEHGGSQNGGYDDDSGSYNKVRNTKSQLVREKNLRLNYNLKHIDVTIF